VVRGVQHPRSRRTGLSKAGGTRSIHRPGDPPERDRQRGARFTFDLTFAEGGRTSDRELNFISILQVVACSAHMVVESFVHRFD